MPREANAESLMEEARAIQAAAMARLDVGDWRDASEKAWCATRNATEAVVPEVTGESSSRSTNVDGAIRALAPERGGEWADMRLRYSDVVFHLHIEAFYGDVYHDDIPDLVRNMADYIQMAEELASGG